MSNGHGVVESSGMSDPAWLQELTSASPRLDLHANPTAADQWLRERYRPERETWVRMNMLGTINARVTGADGTSDSISNRADRRILRLIREMSDVIVVGARTVRTERHLATRPTWLCILTESGDLTGHRIREEDAAASVLVFAPRDAHTRVRATLPGANLVAFNPEHGLARVLHNLHERGLRQVVVEGGTTLISQFLDEQLLDEVCLTQAPVFGAADAPQLPASIRTTSFRRELLLEDEAGYLYQRLIARR